MKQLITIIGALFFTTMLFAQAPQAFNYQGVARDLSGDPLPNQDISLRLGLLQDTPSGTLVYQEIHNVTTNDLGLFTLQVGTGTVVSGIFEAISWGKNSHFLQVEMDESGGSNYQLIGTSQLLSVPYALYAENSGQWEKNDLGIHTLENVYIKTPGTSNVFPDWPLTIQTTPGGDQPGTGFTRDRIMMIYDRQGTPSWHLNLHEGHFELTETNVIGGRIFVEKGGNVGISTQDPKSRFHVAQGDVYIENIGSGVIMKSPNGECWRVTVDNGGQFVSTAIACPDN